MEVRSKGWEKEEEEGPLKLKELHNKVKREQNNDYDEDYEKTKKVKKDEKKPKKTGNYFAGVGDFTEIQDNDEEEEETIEIEDPSLSRFTDIEDSALQEICIGNFKEFLQNPTSDPDFHTFTEATAAGISPSTLLSSLLCRLFEQKPSEVNQFLPYFTLLKAQLSLSPSEITTALCQFHNELVYLECDYVYCDSQYADILREFWDQGLLEVEQVQWTGEDEEESDIFYRVFLKVREKGVQDEFGQFVQKYIEEWESKHGE